MEVKKTEYNYNLYHMKKSFFIMLALLVCGLCPAAERSETQAAAIAAQFVNNHPQMRKAMRPAQTTPAVRLVHTQKKLRSEKAAYYVFNQTGNHGFVIVSGDDRTDDVLVYSDEGSFNQETINPNFRFWLNHMTEVLSAIENDEQAGKTSLKATAVTAIAPLLGNTAWEQSEPYNNLCPIDIWDNTRSLTGCVATAAAQVMRKWRWPLTGTGSKTYIWENYSYDKNGEADKVLQRVPLTANFGETTYDWDNMLDHYFDVNYTSEQANAVATLMYHCGVACEMMYGGDKAGGSGSYTELIGEGLEKYLGYKYDRLLTTYNESDYTYNGQYPMPDGMTVEWETPTSRFIECFNNDLEAGRPIIMGGASNDAGGHEFVCDGRDATGKFHINWGWEGECNCYCSLTLLRPKGESYHFSSTIDALIGLEPVYTEIDTIFVTGVELTPTEIELKINEKQQLSATVLPDDATVRKVTWESSDSNVVTIDENGKVTGVAQGSATITVTTVDGGFSAQCEVRVSNEIMLPEEFTLVTDMQDIAAGYQLLIVGTRASVSQAASNNIKTGSSISRLDVETVTVVDNSITLEDNSNAAIFTLGGSTGAWTLTNQEGAVLGAVAVKKVKWNEGVTTWDISIADGNATIKPVVDASEDYGRIIYNYNNGDSRITLYTSNTNSSMLMPQIYARKRNLPPVTAVESNRKPETTARKQIHGGRLIIIRDGVTYDVLGRKL